ncbi:MAG: CHASE2 domain-containing protein [Phormidesmis sp.]
MSVTFGLLEGLEIGVADYFARLKSFDKKIDDRILVITVGEDDLTKAGQWPMSDKTMAELVREISRYEPSAIGLDIYRNFLVEPGSDELIRVFENTPNVIGIERVVGESVPAHPKLVELDQTAASDLIVDEDGKVRRGLLSTFNTSNEVKETLGTVLAMNYFLHARDISVEILDEEGPTLALGKGIVQPFTKNAGGYVNADEGGFQVLLNYQGNYEKFESIPMSDVLAGKLTEDMVKGRLVFVGATAVSLNDWFATPVGGDQVAGVYMHAHLASQLMDVALEGKSFLRTVPDIVEWLWTSVWIVLSVLVSRSVLYSGSLKSELSIWQMIVRMAVVNGGLVTTGFTFFVLGWWMPLVLPMAAMSVAMMLGMGYRNQKLQNLAAFDELTQIANRRYFDERLSAALKVPCRLSLILCDVDYFKAYNDRYGHPAGDRCLQQVAEALQLAVRTSDLVARYGGEEFVVVLPDTDEALAANIADRIQIHVRQMEIKHEGSQVSEWVTLSCGVATVPKEQTLTPLQLIEYADQALYEAKQSGRNRVNLSQWQALSKYQSDPQNQDDKAA